MPSISEIIPDRKQLTLKEHKFFQRILDGATPTDAAELTFNVKTRTIASVRACQVLKKFKVTLPMLMDQMGITDEQDVKDLLRLRKAKTSKFFAHEGVVITTKRVDDHGTQTRALELSLKLKGYLSDATNVEVNNDFSVIHHMRQALHDKEQQDKNGPAK